MKNKLQLQFYEKESLEKKTLYEEEKCLLCGEELIFTHVSDFLRNYVEEEASCPICGVKNKKTSHCLQ